MIVIGIETSCDETSIGIIKDGREILANIVFTQIKEHKKFAGVVPEIASRLHLQKINYVFQKALNQAKITIDNIDLISVVNQPGLIGSLMIGASFAKSLHLKIKKPIITVNHLIAHLYSNFLKDPVPEFPYIGLLISGGHTLLMIVNSHYDYKIIGTTLDDAVGESYDKVARFLNLGYPGGPVIDKINNEYDGEYIKFTPGLINSKNNKYNFSYSGLKTSVMYYIKENPDYDVNRVVKGFQRSAISVLFEKTLNLSKETRIKEIVIAGGVAANSYLRELFFNLEKDGINVYIPDISLCTDNGAMVGCCAYYKSKLNKYDGLNFDVYSKPKGGPLSYLTTDIS